MSQTQPNKQVVSKSKYVKVMGKRLVLQLGFYHLIFLAGMLGIAAGLCLIGAGISLWHHDLYALAVSVFFIVVTI